MSGCNILERRGVEMTETMLCGNCNHPLKWHRTGISPVTEKCGRILRGKYICDCGDFQQHKKDEVLI